MGTNNGGRGKHSCEHKEHTKKKKLTKKEQKALHHLELFKNKKSQSSARLELEIQSLNQKNAA